LNVPELTPDFSADTRTGQQLLKTLEIDLDPIQPLVIVHDILCQVLVDQDDDFTL